MDEETHPIIESKKAKDVSCLKVTVVALGLGLIVAVSVIIALAIGLGVSASSGKTTGSHSDNPTSSSTPTPTPTPNVCTNESCIELAALVLSGLDTSFKPCDNFYNFSCGKWDASHVLPQGFGRYSTFDELNTRNQIALKRILDDKKDDDVEAVRKVKTLYSSCMDTDTIDDLGAQPLLDLINATGGWSLIDGGSSNWSINGSQFFREKLFGSPAFYELAVDVDDKNSSVNVLQLAQSGISLPSSASYFDNKTATESIQALQTLIVEVLTLLNPNISGSTYQDAAQGIAEFEMSLANIFVSNVDLRDPDKAYNNMTIGDLSSLWPDYDWEEAISNIFEKTVNITVNDTETIIVRTPTYFENLTAVFENAAIDTLENYAKWQLILSYLQFLGKDFLTPYYTFTQITSGSGERERYQTCISVAQEVLPIALARPYADFVLPNGTKDEVSDMIYQVKKAFKERLETKKWLDPETIKLSKEKVDAISQMVAYPDEIHNDTYLNEMYAKYNVTEDMFFMNIVEYVLQSLVDDYSELREPVDKTVWLNAPTAVNAYYSPQFNQFVFLEGILNSPFFQIGWPNYFKYGALGVVIGHELTHGFDDQGQRYNKDGILTPWWTQSSTEHFKERQVCFEEQYSQYELFGYHVNGNLTLGENLADNGGVKTSYQAYQNVVNQTGKIPPLLPAIPYTQDQLYYIAFAQVWCSIFSEKYISSSTKTDPHSPGPFRVIGSLQNDPVFSKVFQCKNDTYMNPPSKCFMW